MTQKKQKAEVTHPLSSLTISRTQILDYLNCGYRWDLSYRRGITGVRVREAMDLGSAVHRAIEHAVAYYAKSGIAREGVYTLYAKAGVKEWAAEERKLRGKLITDEIRTQIKALSDEAIPIAVRALLHFDLSAWEVARIGGQPVFEREFIVPCPPWGGYRTVPDLVARPKDDPKSGWWLIDWKTRGSFESDDAEEVNLQFATMQYILNPALPIEGSLLWQIKSVAPKWPTRNKDGSMSRALINTDWPTYLRALKEAKLDPKDYEADMRPKLEGIEWYRTLKQHRSYKECKAVWEQVVLPAAKRMALSPQVIRRWVHQPFCCSGCWARQFCLAELRGDDTEFLLATDYIDKRNPRKMMEMGDAQQTTFEME